jgi:hypothetical protein
MTSARRGPDTVGHRGQKPPERDVDYTSGCVEELRKASSRPLEIHLFPTAPDAPRDVGEDVTHYNHKTMGLVENSDRMMRYVASLDKPAIQCQDDIVLCRNAIDRVVQVVSEGRPPNAGLISFYTPIAAGQPRGLYHYPAEALYATMLNVWYPSAASEFVFEWWHPKRLCYGDQKTGPRGVKGWDLMVQYWLKWSKKYRAYRHIPCLAQHRGVVSASAKAVGQRTSMNFKGVQYDATKG